MLGLDGFSLPSIDPPAVFAAPGKSRERKDFFLQGVMGRDGHFAGPVDLRHFSQEFQSMIGPPLQHIELPLMDHLMDEGVQEFLFRVRCPFGEPLEQRKRQANLSTAAVAGGISCFRPSTAGEHAD